MAKDQKKSYQNYLKYMTKIFLLHSTTQQIANKTVNPIPTKSLNKNFNLIKFSGAWNPGLPKNPKLDSDSWFIDTEVTSWITYNKMWGWSHEIKFLQSHVMNLSTSFRIIWLSLG